MPSPFQIDVIKRDSWTAMRDFTPTPFNFAAKKVVQAIAEEAERVMKDAIAENRMDGPKQNSPLTNLILQARKKISGRHAYRGRLTQHPLFRNRQIHRAIRTIDLRNGDYFVGIGQGGQTAPSRLTTSADSRRTPLALIARWQEEGQRISVTKKMHFFFRNILRPASGSKIVAPPIGSVIVIPPRSFRAPVVRTFSQRGFGDGIVIERRAELAFLKAIQSNAFVRRFMRRVAGRVA